MYIDIKIFREEDACLQRSSMIGGFRDLYKPNLTPLKVFQACTCVQVSGGETANLEKYINHRFLKCES